MLATQLNLININLSILFKASVKRTQFLIRLQIDSILKTKDRPGDKEANSNQVLLS